MIRKWLIKNIDVLIISCVQIMNDEYYKNESNFNNLYIFIYIFINDLRLFSCIFLDESNNTFFVSVIVIKDWILLVVPCKPSNRRESSNSILFCDVFVSVGINLHQQNVLGAMNCGCLVVNRCKTNAMPTPRGIEIHHHVSIRIHYRFFERFRG